MTNTPPRRPKPSSPKPSPIEWRTVKVPTWAHELAVDLQRRIIRHGTDALPVHWEADPPLGIGALSGLGLQIVDAELREHERIRRRNRSRR